MRKLAILAVVVAVAVMFAVPAFAGCGSPTCSKCAKPCNTCQKTTPCPTCGQPCNVIQSTANVINNMQAPSIPCPKPCNTCPKPCNTCNK